MAAAIVMMMAVRATFFVFVAILLPSSSMGAAEADATGAGMQLYMPDGQLESHPLRVYINHDISDAMNPELWLVGNRAFMHQQNEQAQHVHIMRMVLARHQQWMQSKGGYNASVTGTVMLFDFSASNNMHWYQSVKRYTPILSWCEHDTEHSTTGSPDKHEAKHAVDCEHCPEHSTTSSLDKHEAKRAVGCEQGTVEQHAIGKRTVYVVNGIRVFLWTALAIIIFAVFIGWVSKKRHQGSALGMLRNADGYLSLSRVQVASWTLAIGGMVTGYGLTRLTLPVIPDSLIALMGLSLGTAGISHYQTQKQTDGEPARSRNAYAVSDLICVIGANGSRELSIAQTQMLFWTMMMLLLFIFKSAMSGELWAVPWEMVALMGMSQAGYLAPGMGMKKTEFSKIKTSD